MGTVGEMAWRNSACTLAWLGSPATALSLFLFVSPSLSLSYCLPHETGHVWRLSGGLDCVFGARLLAPAPAARCRRYNLHVVVVVVVVLVLV